MEVLHQDLLLGYVAICIAVTETVCAGIGTWIVEVETRGRDGILGATEVEAGATGITGVVLPTTTGVTCVQLLHFAVRNIVTLVHLVGGGGRGDYGNGQWDNGSSGWGNQGGWNGGSPGYGTGSGKSHLVVCGLL